MNFSKELKEARERSNLTIEDLADVTGFTAQDISCYEDGKFLPTEEKLDLLDGLFDEEFDDVLKKQKDALIVGKNLKNLCKKCNVSLKYVAEITEIPMKDLVEYAQGFAMPQKATLEHIAECLGKSATELTNGIEFHEVSSFKGLYDLQEVAEERTLGEKIAFCRKKAKMTLRELSNFCGVTDSTISHYEHDKTLPAPEILNKIAEALGVEVDSLKTMDYEIESKLKEYKTQSKRRSTLASNIRKYRKLKGLSIKELAKILGCTAGSISNIENDFRKPSKRLVSKIAEVLDVPMSALITDEELQSLNLRVGNYFLPPKSIAECNFGERILLYRKQANLTTRELGAMCGVSDAAISCYENGHYRPTPDVFIKLAGALGVTTTMLLGGNVDVEDVQQEVAVKQSRQSEVDVAQSKQPVIMLGSDQETAFDLVIKLSQSNIMLDNDVAAITPESTVIVVGDYSEIDDVKAGKIIAYIERDFNLAIKMSKVGAVIIEKGNYEELLDYLVK